MLLLTILTVFSMLLQSPNRNLIPPFTKCFLYFNIIDTCCYYLFSQHTTSHESPIRTDIYCLKPILFSLFSASRGAFVNALMLIFMIVSPEQIEEVDLCTHFQSYKSKRLICAHISKVTKCYKVARSCDGLRCVRNPMSGIFPKHV